MTRPNVCLLKKLFLTINSIFFVILILLGAKLYTDHTQTVQKEYEKKIRLFGESMTTIASKTVDNENSIDLENYYQKIIDQNLISQISIKNNDESVIFSKKSPFFEAENKKISLILEDSNKQKIGSLEINYTANGLESQLKEKLFYFSFCLIITFITIVALTFILIRRTNSNLSLKILSLKDKAIKTKQSAQETKNISEKLSSFSTEQAASIQETVSTLEEISTQVRQNLENVQQSSDKSEESFLLATDGKKIVLEMKTSIEEIEKSNHNIMEEISKGNERIAGIVEIINEISQKTAVIDQIVFQTRLLSFNASVEAARAGEHGKGFSVVAEEVGKLALVSGNASKDINEIIGQSVQRVNQVINETNENVKKLIQDGDQKIKSGAVVAQKCEKVLENIVNISLIVKQMIGQIASASKEQNEGVQNITIAMNQLDQTTNLNSKSATDMYESSKYTSEQSDLLIKTVGEFECEILNQIDENAFETQKIQNINQDQKELSIPQPIKIESKNSETKKSIVAKTREHLKVLKNEKLNNSKQDISKVHSKKVTALVSKKNEKIIDKSPQPSTSTKAKPLAIPSHDDPRFEDV